MPLMIQNRQRTVRIQTPTIRKRLLQVLEYLGCANDELSVVFVSDRRMRSLNRAYRQQDRPTNVLAFPQRSAEADDPATPLLGDVIVALPTAAREAQALQQSLEERVLYLLIHGLLHLLGHDHERSATERHQMEAREQEILAHLAARRT